MKLTEEQWVDLNNAIPQTKKIKSKYEDISKSIGCLVLGFFIGIILVIGLIWGIIFKQKTINKLQDELTTTRERGVNDSILVSNYQSAIYQFIKTSPDCAEKFRNLLEEKDTK